MGWFDKSPPPVRIADVPRVVAAILESANLAHPDSGDVGVYSQQERLERPYRPITGGAQAQPRVEVTIPQASMARQESPVGRAARQEMVVFWVTVGVPHDPEGASGFDYLEVMQDLHDDVFAAVQGERLSVPGHEAVQPVSFAGYKIPQFVEPMNAWFMTAEYRTVLRRT